MNKDPSCLHPLLLHMEVKPELLKELLCAQVQGQAILVLYKRMTFYSRLSFNGYRLDTFVRSTLSQRIPPDNRLEMVRAFLSHFLLISIRRGNVAETDTQ